MKNELEELRYSIGLMADNDLIEFGELIVQECIKSIESESLLKGIQLTPGSDMVAMGMKAAIGSIKRRFKVEQ